MLLFVYVLTFAVFVLLFTREVIAPASGASCDKRWRIYAGALNALNVTVVVAAGLIFPATIAQISLVELHRYVGIFGQSAIIFLTASFFAYWWHRATHASDTIWRMVHQLHHSPSRVEALTAFYLHPLDSFLAAMLNALIAYALLGASPWAAGLALLYVSIFNLVAHADMRTPWWLGFVTQRPEMHRLHHQRGVHRWNYGLPLWDLMFGTWRNPKSTTVECGFAPENEFRVREMLLMKSVEE